MENITNFENQNIPIIKSKNIYKILFFVLLALLLIIASILAALFVNKTKNSVSNQTVSDLNISPTISPTLDFKTYNSSNLGFSFRYPSDWNLSETDQSITLKNNYDTFTIYFSNLGRGFEGVASFIKYDAVIKNNAIILSNQTRKISKALETANGNVLTKGYVIATVAGEYTFTMEGVDLSKIDNGISTFEQILKSFKFKNSLSTQNWKTYDSYQGFTIKAPSNYFFYDNLEGAGGASRFYSFDINSGKHPIMGGVPLDEFQLDINTFKGNGFNEYIKLLSNLDEPDSFQQEYFDTNISGYPAKIIKYIDDKQGNNENVQYVIDRKDSYVSIIMSVNSKTNKAVKEKYFLDFEKIVDSINFN